MACARQAFFTAVLSLFGRDQIEAHGLGPASHLVVNPGFAGVDLAAVEVEIRSVGGVDARKVADGVGGLHAGVGVRVPQPAGQVSGLGAATQRRGDGDGRDGHGEVAGEVFLHDTFSCAAQKRPRFGSVTSRVDGICAANSFFRVSRHSQGR